MRPIVEILMRAKIRNWQHMQDMSARLLKERTGEDVARWNERIKRAGLENERKLRAWLTEKGVTGYPQSLLVMERFGYPDFLTATADELIESQYADRPKLRRILDTIIDVATELGEVTVQARKTYVSLVGRRRTFARIQPTTKDRVDLALRLKKSKPGGRLVPSRIHETMKVQISLKTRDEVDSEVLAWLERAYADN